MQCKKCGYHILATMQVMWNGYSYHADCVGEAIAQKRAEESLEDKQIKQELQTFDDDFEEQFANEFEEDFDDLEPEEVLDKP